MTKTLKDLFYGNLSLSDRSMPKGSAMYRLSTKLCKREEALAQRLGEDDKEYLEALTHVQWEIDCLTAEENFILGFRLGVRIMAECLMGEDLTDG